MKGEFFVATVQAELDAQPDLRALLEQRYPLLERDGPAERWHYVVYDLRHTRVSITPDQVSVFGRVGRQTSPTQTVALWALPDARWTVVPRAPDVVTVSPVSGAGPATLTLSLRPSPAEFDRTFAVEVFGDGQRTPSATLTVRARAVRAARVSPPFGFVDAPPDPVSVGEAAVVFQGWALDEVRLGRVFAGYRDRSGNVIDIGNAVPGGLRADVAAAHPNAHDIYHSAWVFTLRRDMLCNQPPPITIRFFAENADGQTAEIGNRVVTCR
jgi:hypothetical protein